MRQNLYKWTVAAWCKVPNLRQRDGYTDGEFIDDKFKNPISPKDGYAVPDCKDVRARRVLEFLVPLLYSEKHTRVTMTIGNTIFGALSGEREVDWALVIRDTIKRLLTMLGKSKALPIFPFVFHLYITHSAIRLEDKKAYMVGESMMKYNVESGDKEELAGLEDSKCKSLDAKEIATL